MSDIEREEFEQAVTDRWSNSYSFTRFGDEDYYDEVLEGMWWGWQASRQVDGESVAYQYWWPESPRQVTVCKAKDLPSGGPDLIVQPLYTHPASAAKQAVSVPSILYDGYAVFQEVQHARNSKGLENIKDSALVSDVLDAVVKLIKQEQDDE